MVAKWIGIFFLLVATSAIAQSQLEMNEKSCGDYQKVDEKLNSTYKKILKTYDGDTVFINKLKKAQRAWLAYRDAEMLALYPDTSPDAYGSAHPYCDCVERTSLTQARTEELERWLKGTPEGDICSGSINTKP